MRETLLRPGSGRSCCILQVVHMGSSQRLEMAGEGPGRLRAAHPGCRSSPIWRDIHRNIGIFSGLCRSSWAATFMNKLYSRGLISPRWSWTSHLSPHGEIALVSTHETYPGCYLGGKLPKVPTYLGTMVRTCEREDMKASGGTGSFGCVTPWRGTWAITQKVVISRVLL